MHDNEPPRDTKPGDERAPHPDNMQGGKDPGARARSVVGIYRRGNGYRATTTKNEHGPARWPNGPTCEFKFNYQAAMVEPEAGRVVDVDAERAAEKRDAADAALSTSIENSVRRAELLKKRKESMAAPTMNQQPAPPQGELSLMPPEEPK